MQVTLLDVRRAVNCKVQSKSAIPYPNWLELQKNRQLEGDPWLRARYRLGDTPHASLKS